MALVETLRAAVRERRPESARRGPIDEPDPVLALPTKLESRIPPPGELRPRTARRMGA